VDKPGKKVRDIKFFSEKNQAVIVVHSEEARAYSKYLEDWEEVESYEVNKRLDEGRMRSVPRVDIRADFLKQEWTTDFYLRFEDGTVGIREIVQQTALQKRAEVEKLELSRRYWTLMGVKDWKVVVMGK
jgi:putative heme degradation protein